MPDQQLDDRRLLRWTPRPAGLGPRVARVMERCCAARLRAFGSAPDSSSIAATSVRSAAAARCRLVSPTYNQCGMERTSCSRVTRIRAAPGVDRSTRATSRRPLSTASKMASIRLLSHYPLKAASCQQEPGPVSQPSPHALRRYSERPVNGADFGLPPTRNTRRSAPRIGRRRCLAGRLCRDRRWRSRRRSPCCRRMTSV